MKSSTAVSQFGKPIFRFKTVLNFQYTTCAGLLYKRDLAICTTATHTWKCSCYNFSVN